MHEHPAEWCLRSSKRQRQLEVAALFLCSLILLQILNAAFLGAAFLPLIYAVWLWRNPLLDVHLGVNQQGWWLLKNGHKHYVSWQVGSIRRRGYVCLVWGFWPWQSIRIRPDSLPDEESFRRLKFALYGSV